MLKQFDESKLQDLNDTDRILVKFSASWCAPCKTITPILEDLSNKGYKIFEVDAEQNKELVQKYNVRSVPTCLIMNKTQVLNTLVGAKDKSVYLRALES